MPITLEEIPGLNATHQSCWQVRALAIDGKSPALAALDEWASSSPDDYKKILKVLRMVGQFDRVHDETKVTKSADSDHGDVYEIRAHKGHARLFFFYSESDESVIVCTNSFWKGKGSQSAAFALCAKLKALFLRTQHESQSR